MAVIYQKHELKNTVPISLRNYNSTKLLTNISPTFVPYIYIMCTEC